MLKSGFRNLFSFLYVLEIFVIAKSLVIYRKDFVNVDNCTVEINGNSLTKGFNITVDKTHNRHTDEHISDNIYKEEIINIYSYGINKRKKTYIRLANVPINFLVKNRNILLKLISPACETHKLYGKWNFTITVEQILAENCKDLGLLENGFRKGLNLSLGSVIEFSCKEGYSLIGSNFIQCMKNKVTFELQWSKSFPKCIQNCEKPEPSNFRKNAGNSYSLNSSIYFDCDEPYSLVGSKTLTCVLGENGKARWNTDIPQCVLKGCEKEVHSVSDKISVISITSSLRFKQSKCHFLELSPLPGYCTEIEISKLYSSKGENIKIFNKERDILQHTDSIQRNYHKLTVCDNVYIYYSINRTDQGTNQHVNKGLYLTYMATPVTDRNIFYKRKLAAYIDQIPEDDELTLTSTSSGVSDGNSGNQDNHAGAIAAGVIVPVFILSVIAVIVYIWYRKKYPVRMIIGKDFGKFTNPTYEKRASTLTLVRGDAFDEAYKKDIEAGAAAKEVSTHDENMEYINEQQYQPTNVSFMSTINVSEMPDNSQDLAQKKLQKTKHPEQKKTDKESKSGKKLIKYVKPEDSDDDADYENSMIESAEQMITGMKAKASEMDESHSTTENYENDANGETETEALSQQQTSNATSDNGKTSLHQTSHEKNQEVNPDITDIDTVDIVDGGNFEMDNNSNKVNEDDDIGQRDDASMKENIETQKVSLENETNNLFAEEEHQDLEQCSIDNPRNEIVENMNGSLNDGNLLPEDAVNSGFQESDKIIDELGHVSGESIVGDHESSSETQETTVTEDNLESGSLEEDESIEQETSEKTSLSSYSNKSDIENVENDENKNIGSDTSSKGSSSEDSFIVFPKQTDKDSLSTSDEIVMINHEYINNDTFSIGNPLKSESGITSQSSNDSFEKDKYDDNEDKNDSITDKDIKWHENAFIQEEKNINGQTCNAMASSDRHTQESLLQSDEELEINQQDESILTSEDKIVEISAFPQANNANLDGIISMNKSDEFHPQANNGSVDDIINMNKSDEFHPQANNGRVDDIISINKSDEFPPQANKARVDENVGMTKSASIPDQMDSFEMVDPQQILKQQQSIASDISYRTLSSIDVDEDFAFQFENLEDMNFVDVIRNTYPSSSENISNNQIEELLGMQSNTEDVPTSYKLSGNMDDISSSNDQSISQEISMAQPSPVTEDLEDMSKSQNKGRRESISLENPNFGFDLSFQLVDKDRKDSNYLTKSIDFDGKRKNVTFNIGGHGGKSSSSDSEESDDLEQDTTVAASVPIFHRRESITIDNPSFHFDDQNTEATENRIEESFLVVDKQTQEITGENKPTFPIANDKMEMFGSVDAPINDTSTDIPRKRITFNLEDINNDSNVSNSDTDSEESDGDEGSYTINQAEDTSPETSEA